MTSPRLAKSDIKTYIRLVKYLKGYGAVVFLLFLCIFLEAFFTVTTIASLKPILDLIQNTSLLDMTAENDSGGEVGELKFFEDGTAAIRLAGDLNSAKRLRSATQALLDSGRSNLILDASQAARVGYASWGQLYQTGLQLEGQTSNVTVLLAPKISPPPGLETSRLQFLDAATSAAAPLHERYLSEMRDVNPATIADTGIFDLRKRFTGWIEPHLKRLQNYAYASPENKVRVLKWIVAAMVFSAIMTAICGFAIGYLSNFLSASVVNRLRNHAFSHQLTLDLSHFTANPHGKLMSVVLQDVKAVESAINLLFSNVFKTPITVIVLVSAMLFVSPGLTLFTFIIVPVLTTVLYVVGRRVRRVSLRVQQAIGVLSTILEESITAIRVVKAFNMEDRESERFRKETRYMFRLGRRSKAAEELGTMLTQIFGIIMVASILMVGGNYILSGELESSRFVLFVGFLIRLFQPLKGMSRVTTRLQRGLAGCDRVFSMLDLRPTIFDKPNAIVAPRLSQAIEFENVSFRYAAGKQPALNQISLRLPAGKAIALVGETGSGKSTLVNLLPRFYDPTDGRITYDGIDLRDLQVKSLRDQIAIITQDVVLFDDTIARNIAYGFDGKELPMGRIKEAARAANAHGFITEKLADGYNTTVGTRGTRLSGGERQRIAIARAIFRDVPILILDEATSALDSQTEALIQEALNRLMKGRTVIVVAHRLSTIQSCDEIYVMESGRFVEHGTHEELLQSDGLYARFHRIQFATGPAEPQVVEG